jgi:hypothetical protein
LTLVALALAAAHVWRMAPRLRSIVVPDHPSVTSSSVSPWAGGAR